MVQCSVQGIRRNLIPSLSLSLSDFHSQSPPLPPLTGHPEDKQVARDVRRKGAGRAVGSGDKVRGKGASAEPSRYHGSAGNLYSGQEPQQRA